MADVISRNRAARSGVVRWLVFSLVSLLVPVRLLRQVPRKQRKVAWQLIVPPIAGAAVVMGTWGGVRQSRWDRAYGDA
ncbi:hypothetical protein [Streptomyces coelicoflavus]|uniref:hypothetical protein n=1 Tax=Streptomyces coelicoflavus TaxID=285562 RepID=UPI0036CAE934